MWFDVFKVFFLAYFYVFFSYLRFNIFYPAHEYMLDMDECLDASLVYLW
jgi:hypothetical protein